MATAPWKTEQKANKQQKHDGNRIGIHGPWNNQFIRLAMAMSGIRDVFDTGSDLSRNKIQWWAN